MIRVIVPAYECPEAFQRCLSSLESQIGAEFSAVLIDDASPDTAMALLATTMAMPHPDWQVLLNEDRRGTLANIATGISYASPSPEDIIFLLDGDDWLPAPDVLARVQKLYDSDPDCWVAYGSYRSDPPDEGCVPASAYPADVTEARAFRGYHALFNHPLTFRAFLWAQIRDEDLKDATGHFFSTSYDQAIMYPLLEIAGPNHRYVEDVLYVYNSANPLSEWRVAREQAASDVAEIIAKPRRPRMIRHDGGLLLDGQDKVDVVVGYVRDSGLSHFVETGTGRGFTTSRIAQECALDGIITIESDVRSYRESVRRLARMRHVRVIHGHSVEILRQIIDEIPPSVWWLDAHLIDWQTAPAEMERTPILDELHLVLARCLPDVVLIDDARLFGLVPGWPTLQELRDHIWQLDEGFGTHHEFGRRDDIVRLIPA